MDKDTADLQKITAALGDRVLTAGQLAVETQLPAQRVIHLLGPRCKEGGPYSRRDEGGVYKYSIAPVTPSGPPSKDPSAEEQELIGKKYALTKLLIADGAPNAIVMAVQANRFDLVKDYVWQQRVRVRKEEADLAARVNRVGQLESLLDK